MNEEKKTLKEHNKIHHSLYKKLRIRVCGICIKENMILLVKHENLGNKKTLWTPPGGGMEFHESVHQTIKREMLEETGFNVSVGKLLFVNEYYNGNLHSIELFFYVEIINGNLICGTDPEYKKNNQLIKEVKFLSFTEVKNLANSTKHNILYNIYSFDELLKKSGYFNFWEEF